MLKRLARKVAELIAPLVIKELIDAVEKILKVDINQDGKIGE